MEQPVGEAPSEPPQDVQRPAGLDALFGDRTSLMERYVAHLADTGVSHGLIGPRERPRLWDRHVLNCAAVGELVPRDADVADVGSGAGLPGLVLAIARPDIRMTLIEPLLRRVTWLTDVLDDLGLDNVEIRRARAEQLWGEVEVDIVTSRAVARLEELARWSLPLLHPRGTMLALKGSSAPEELDRSRDRLHDLGAGDTDIVECSGLAEQATTVIRIQLRGAAVRVHQQKRGKSQTSGGRRRAKQGQRHRRSRSNR